MKLLAMTDLHGRLEKLDRILRAAGPVDALLLGGDLTNFGSPRHVAELLGLAGRSGRPVWAVAGNCDSAAIDRVLVEQGAGLHGRAAALDRMGIQGLSAAPPWMPRMYHFTEDELGQALRTGCAQLPETDFHVVLAHVPPHDCRLDRTGLGDHVGSRALRRFIDEHQPDLVVCGHVHEARGTERLGETLVVNCGPAAGGCYALIDLDQRIDVELCRL